MTRNSARRPPCPVGRSFPILGITSRGGKITSKDPTLRNAFQNSGPRPQDLDPGFHYRIVILWPSRSSSAPRRTCHCCGLRPAGPAPGHLLVHKRDGMGYHPTLGCAACTVAPAALVTYDSNIHNQTPTRPTLARAGHELGAYPQTGCTGREMPVLSSIFRFADHPSGRSSTGCSS
jgi:hypothetical protein